MTTYEKSNSVTEVRLKSFKKEYASRILSCNDNPIEREKVSQELIDYLCDKFNVSHVNVSVLNLRQKSIRNGHVCGDYNRYLRKIRIYNLTEKMAKVVSIKSFYETLLHEFIHHYDLNVLKMQDTPHTSGFYKRISDLKSKLEKK